MVAVLSLRGFPERKMVSKLEKNSLVKVLPKRKVKEIKTLAHSTVGKNPPKKTLYGRIIDKFNKSCALSIFFVNIRITKNGAIVEKRGIFCLPYLLNEFGGLNFFVCFYYLHIINFKPKKFQRMLM